MKTEKDLQYGLVYEGQRVGQVVPLPQHEDTDGSMVVTGKNNPLPFSLDVSNVMIPMDIQSRYALTIQTHNAVSVPTTTMVYGAWIDCSGFDKMGITFLNDAKTTASIQVRWSNDGVNAHGITRGMMDGVTNREESKEFSITARYASVSLYNGDTVAHTMSAWAYLKA